MFLSKIKLSGFSFLSLALFWSAVAQADPALKVEGIESGAIEKESPETREIQIAARESGVSKIPFSLRKRRPEGDIRVGRFEVQPGASIAYKYDDNVFLDADRNFANNTFESPTSDSVALLKGSLLAGKELRPGDSWGFHMFYEAQNESFIKHSRLDFLQHDLDTELALAGPGGRSKLTLFGNYLKTVFPISPQFATNFNPRSARALTQLGERFQWALTSRTVLELDAKIGLQRFESSSLQQEDRNNFNVNSSLLWAWTKLTSFGMNLLFDNTHYTQPETFNNDSNLYGAFFVARFEPSAFISGDLGIGYQKRFVVGADSRGGFSYKMNLKYDYSDRTKFFLTGKRGVQDSTFRRINFNIRTSANIAWEQQWPLFPKFGSRVFFGIENLDFNQAQADTVNGGGAFKKRNDDLTTAGIDLIYNIQKWLDAEIEYKRAENSSNFASFNYLSNIITLSVTAVF